MKKEYIFMFMVVVLLLGLSSVFANGSHTNSEFPEWTYWVEIIEHSAITLIAILAVFYLLILRKKSDTRIEAANLMIFGLVLLALSQLLTNIHHFLIYPFGMWNAVVHHGLLLVSIIIIVYAYIRLMIGKGIGVKLSGGKIK